MANLRPNEKRVDWFQILADLRRIGLTDVVVAEQTGIPRTTLLGYKQGAEPKHADGERLLAFWRQNMIPPVPTRSPLDPA